jgi:predicted CXXCH cytochrome family protein
MRAVSETNPCVFCHISHTAGPKSLSNRPDPGNRHQPYESSTMKAKADKPTGASRICLSCHDGTIAPGQTRNGRIRMVGGERPIEVGKRSNLGTDLRRSHPVSFRPAASSTVHPPRGGDKVKLDGAGRLECTSCHDPHSEYGDPVVGKFLVKQSEGSALCLSCHEAGVGGAASATHLASSASFTDGATGQVKKMASAGCATCHVPHAGDVRGRLLRTDQTGDDLCLGCHGDRSEKPISPEVAKPWSHAPDRARRHDASEGPQAPGDRKLPEGAPGQARHVSCVDCHDPHRSNAAPTIAPSVGGALAGMWGIDLNGERIAPATYQYQVCFKCHADSANRPQEQRDPGERVRRATPDTNLRLVFSPDAASSHPVAAPGRNPVVPSLKPEYAPSSLILCTDCHASDAGATAGGSAARGPHGSIHSHLLEREYQTADHTPESPSAYALCYKCHDRATLLSDRSSFPLHAQHVAGTPRTPPAPCSACHDAHGVSLGAGNARNNAHLISFDLSIVGAPKGSVARYESTGQGHGSCALSCHGRDHGPTEKAWSY